MVSILGEMLYIDKVRGGGLLPSKELVQVQVLVKHMSINNEKKQLFKEQKILFFKCRCYGWVKKEVMKCHMS